MHASFAIYDNQNRQMDTFGGPHRLAKWKELPDGWTIEEFWGTVSRGRISLEQVKELAAADLREREELGAKLPVIDHKPRFRTSEESTAHRRRIIAGLRLMMVDIERRNGDRRERKLAD